MNSFLREIKNSCSENSLYSLIKDDQDTNFDKLVSNFKNEIQSFYNDTYNHSSNYLIDRKELSVPKCSSINDRMALQLSFSANTVRLTRILERHKDSLEQGDLSISEQLTNLDSNPEDIILLENDPFFRNILNLKSFDLSNLPASVINNGQVQQKITSNLNLKCKETFELAKNTLCNSDKNNSSLNFKSMRTILKEVDDKDNLKQAQYLTLLCGENPPKDISVNLDTMNEQLPSAQQTVSPNEILSKSYKEQFHTPKENICEYIPKNVASFEEGMEKLGCNNKDGYSEKCLHLEAYIKLNTPLNSPSTQVAQNQSETPETGTPQGKESSNTGENLLNSFSKPSKLISNFIGLEEEEKTVDVPKAPSDIVLEQPESESTTQVAQTREQTSSDSVTNNNSQKQKVAFNKKTKQSYGIKQSPNTNYSTQNYSPTTTTNNYQARAQDDSMNEFYKELADKIKRSQSHNSKVVRKSKSALKEARKLLKESQNKFNSRGKARNNSIASNSRSPQSYSQDTKNIDEQDMEEYLNSSMSEDQSFGTRPPRSRRSQSQGKKASSPSSLSSGYSYKNIRGDIVNLQGIEVGSIPNHGFEGVIGEEVPEVVLYGELEENLGLIDLDKVVTYDNSKGDVSELINLVKNGKPFVIRRAGYPDQKILVKRNGDQFELVKKSDSTDTAFNDFYENVQKALEEKIMSSIQLKSSVVTVSER